MELLPARVHKVIGPIGVEKQAAGVIIATQSKSFLIVVGLPEAQAIVREMDGDLAKRPMTHDLMVTALSAFDIKFTKVVISSLVETTFCATIFLERQPEAEAGGPAPFLERAVLDARASDSIVLALKAKVPLEVSRQVLDAALDIKEQFAGTNVQGLLQDLAGGLEEPQAEEDEPPEFDWLTPESDEPDDE